VARTVVPIAPPDNVNANIQVNANDRFNAEADANGHQQFRGLR
jgi:hypothetical protein